VNTQLFSTAKSARQRVVVAMSGGVDSSTVAGLLVEAGHEVIGIAMKTHRGEVRGARACCTPDDMRDARQVADLLQIPFYVLNYADMFHSAVVEPFAAAYRSGQTPNPCVECNDRVKFKPLLQRAKLLQAARPQRFLQRGVDPQKDQSYFLYRLDSTTLGEVQFPLGGLCKAQVREHAKRLGLPVADKQESQEICFVGAAGYAQTVEQVAPSAESTAGPIVDADGKVLGQHDGVHHFTVGQRRGLNLSGPAPQYVTAVDASSRQVQVGPRQALQVDFVDLGGVHWLGDTALLQACAERPICLAQRYRDVGSLARLEIRQAQPLQLRAHFCEPQLGGAPGQAAVIYGSGDPAVDVGGLARSEQIVLGGGQILPNSRQQSLRVLS
jgi:tRNA-specific 2-thiouridylase